MVCNSALLLLLPCCRYRQESLFCCGNGMRRWVYRICWGQTDSDSDTTSVNHNYAVKVLMFPRQPEPDESWSKLHGDCYWMGCDTKGFVFMEMISHWLVFAVFTTTANLKDRILTGKHDNSWKYRSTRRIHCKSSFTAITKSKSRNQKESTIKASYCRLDYIVCLDRRRMRWWMSWCTKEDNIAFSIIFLFVVIVFHSLSIGILSPPLVALCISVVCGMEIAFEMSK